MYPTDEQGPLLEEHCAQARFIWNLALEQANFYRPHWGSTPNHLEQCRQLTELRAAFDWLRAGSQTVQQQALRDFDQAMQNWWGGSHRRPTWRKVGLHEGFRQVGLEPRHVKRVNRKWGQVHVPKIGLVRFRWTRRVPDDVKSYRVTKDRAGRWHIAFAVIPPKIDGPDDGSHVGIDRGVVCTVATSDGEMFHAPTPDRARQARLQRRLSRKTKGSNRRNRARLALAKHQAKEVDRRKDFIEKVSTDLIRRFDVVVIEDLRIKNMVKSAKGTIQSPGHNVKQKAGLNRSILEQGWGLFAKRLSHKGTVVKVPAAFTSITCSACRHPDKNSRKSQAEFLCCVCGVVEHADVNAAKNIRTAGQAVAGRGDIPKAAVSNCGVLSAKRQPQLSSG